MAGGRKTETRERARPTNTRSSVTEANVDVPPGFEGHDHRSNQRSVSFSNGINPLFEGNVSGVSIGDTSKTHEVSNLLLSISILGAIKEGSVDVQNKATEEKATAEVISQSKERVPEFSEMEVENPHVENNHVTVIDGKEVSDPTSSTGVADADMLIVPQ